MRLSHDYIHAFRGLSGVCSACRLRLYLPDEDKILDDAPVVIISELPDNPGTSVTNAIEQITAEVMDAHSLGFERAPVFVEHYPPEATGRGEETFDLVVFGHHEVREGPSTAMPSRSSWDPRCRALELRQRTVHNAQDLCAHRE